MEGHSNCGGLEVSTSDQAECRNASSPIFALWEDLIQRRLSVYSHVLMGENDDACLRRTREDLTEELLAIDTFVPLLRSRRNALSPVFRLPPELLSKIFHLCTFNNPRFFYNSDYLPRSSTLSWIRLAHICSHWRKIACTDPLLWTYFGEKLSNEGIDTMLCRAQSAPLTFDIESSCRKLLSFLPAHLSRISDLRMRIDAEDMSRVFSLFSVSPAQHMVSLHLGPCQIPPPDAPLLLPSALFTSMPALRSLGLHDISIDSVHTLPSTLESLEYTLWGRHTRQSSVRQLSTLLLKNSASLKVLDIREHSYGSQDSSLIPPLRSLQSLSLCGSMEICDTLLAMLRIPSTCRATIEHEGKITGSQRDFSSINFSAILSRVSRYLEQKQNFSGIKKLEVAIEDGCVISLVGWRTIDSPRDHYDFRVAFSYMYESTPQQILDIFREAPLQEVTSLELTAWFYIFDGWSWMDVAKMLPNVTRLFVWLDATNDGSSWWPDFCRALTPGFIADASSSTPALIDDEQRPSILDSLPLFHRLARLDINTEGDLERLEELDWHFNTIYDMLLARREAGFGVKELHLTGESASLFAERMLEVVESVSTSKCAV